MQRGVLVVIAALLLVLSAQAQGQHAQHLPIVVNPRTPGPTNTPTNTFPPNPRGTNTPTRTSPPTNTPTNTGTPTNTPQLPPPSYNACQPDPNPSAAPNYPVRITAIDKEAETVTLQNVSSASINLTGWNMCSITGNQHHPISGTLAPGQSVTFPGPPGSIWNNATEDDGALYTPGNQLASYFDA